MTLMYGILLLLLAAGGLCTTLEDATTADYSLILTPQGVVYGLNVLTVALRSGFMFGLRGCKDARIGITSIHSDGSQEITEINFGTTSNTQITVTNKQTDQVITALTQPTPVLSCFVFKFFWVTWKDGKLSVGQGTYASINIGRDTIFTLQPVGTLWQDVATVDFVSSSTDGVAWYLPEDQGENLIVITPAGALIDRIWRRVDHQGEFMTFDVKSADDIKIFLSPARDFRVYELYIKRMTDSTSWSVGMNKYSRPQGPQVVIGDSGLLSAQQFRQFWISWNNGTIKMGKGPAENKFEIYSWTDPNAVPIHFMSVANGDAAEGQWVFLDTYENIYVFASYQKTGSSNLYDGSLISPRTGTTFFSVQACQNVRVSLGRSPLEFAGDFEYFIDIGVQNNTVTQISHGFEFPPVASRSTPGILDCTQPRSFWIQWGGSLLRMGAGITPGLFSFINYTSSFDTEFDAYEAIGFFADHQSGGTGAVYAMLDNSGDQAFIQTYDNYGDQDTWVTVKNEFFRTFTLRACSDAYISVTEVAGGPTEYELVFGYLGVPTDIAARRAPDPFISATIPDGLVDCDEDREFWISWMDGTFRVGKGHHLDENLLLIAWDSMPYPVNSLALATGNQQFGTWVFEMDSGDEMTISTSPTVVKLVPSRNAFYLRIKGSNAQVTLSSSYSQSVTGYTLIFGDRDPSAFTIKNPSGTILAQATLRFSLHPTYLTDFWISWVSGQLVAGYGRLAGQNTITQGVSIGSFKPVSVQLAGPTAEFVALAELGPETTFVTRHLPSLNISYDQFWYHMRRRTTLLFGLTACQSASVILTPVPNDLSLLTTYRILLGGANNDVLSVSAGPRVATMSTPGLLDCNVEKMFWITWSNRILDIGTGTVVGSNLLISVSDLPVTIPVNAVTFGVAGNQTAIWRVSNNQEPLDASASPGEDTSGGGGLSSGAVAGIVIGVLLLVLIVGIVAYVALKGVPEPVRNVFSDTKEAADASVQFQHSNLDAPSGDA